MDFALSRHMPLFRTFFLIQLGVSHFLGYLLPLTKETFSLSTILLILLPSVRDNDKIMVAFSIFFFVAGSIRGVMLGEYLGGGSFIGEKETVRFFGKVTAVRQSGPLVGLIIEEGGAENIYGSSDLVSLEKFVAYTYGNSRFYEGREGNRIIGIGRTQNSMKTGIKSLYAARDLLRGNSCSINTEREKILFFGEKKERSIRRKLISTIEGGFSGGRVFEMGREFLLSILTGERPYNTECRKLLIDSGLAHLLAISGLHVGVAFLFFAVVFRIFFLLLNHLGFTFDMNIPSFIAGAVAALAYAFLAGMPVTVTRAYSMMVFSALAVRKYDGGSVFTPISFAFFVIIVSEPAQACSASFVFSFVITAYLVLLLRGIPDIGSNKLKANLVISFTAYLAAIPLSAYFFQRVSLFSFIFNFFFVPLFIPLIGLSLCWAFLCLIKFPGIWFAGSGLMWLADTLLRSLRWLVSYTGSAARVVSPDVSNLLYYFIALTFIYSLSLNTEKKYR